MKKQQSDEVAPISIFYCYADEDEWLLKKLETHLSSLRKQGVIIDWHKRKIMPGDDWQQVSDTHLKAASIILALISPDFIASDYCYGFEMEQALVKQKEGTGIVIPIILRPVDWQSTPFAKLQCLPCNAKPITLWNNPDAAFHNVVKGIRKAIEHLRSSPDPCSQSSTSLSTLKTNTTSLIANRYICGSVQEHVWDEEQPITDFSYNAPVSTAPRARNKYRQLMLRRVYSYWISGLLERPLYTGSRIVLRFKERPDVVENPWRLQIQKIDTLTHLLPEETSIADVYEQSEHQLLVLGEPGAGKTTLLLELARDLLNRAEQDEAHPIPVVFNLSSWALKKQSLVDWLVEELQSKYQVSRSLARTWVEKDQLLLLLDGFDEVATTHRAAFISAFSTYRHEHGFVPIVICSRSAEYLSQPKKLPLRNAIIIQPLTDQQIDEYIKEVDKSSENIYISLQKDKELRDLVTTPLMLSILTLAYDGRTIEDVLSNSSPEAKQQQIFTTYVQRMLQRRGRTHYTLEQINHWLVWLARQLSLRQQTEFYTEQIQPDWLPNERLMLLYQLVVCIIFGLFIGLPSGLFVGLVQGWSAALNQVGNGTIEGFMLAGFRYIYKVFADQRYRWDVTNGNKPSNFDQNMRLHIEPAKDVTWSWPGISWLINTCWPQIWQLETTKKQRTYWRKINIFFLLTVLAVSILAAGIEGMLILTSILLMLIFTAGFTSKEESDPILMWTKARGIWQSIKTGTFISILLFLAGGVIAGLFFMQFRWFSNKFTGGWITKLIFGLFLAHSAGFSVVTSIINLIISWGMSIGLLLGGSIFIEQIMLRLFLVTA